MNENINIAKILEKAPNGLELYSPLFGTVKLWKSNRIPAMIELNNNYPIRVETICSTIEFDEYGRPAMFRNPECECMLFPSKENRNWSTFRAPWRHKHFEPFEKVLIVNKYSFEQAIWVVSLYSFYRDGVHYTLSGVAFSDNDILPYKGNENKLGKPVE